MLHLIAAALAFAVTVVCALMGVDWITLGYGLNPYIAFPVALGFSYLSFISVRTGVAELR